MMSPMLQLPFLAYVHKSGLSHFKTDLNVNNTYTVGVCVCVWGGLLQPHVSQLKDMQGKGVKSPPHRVFSLRLFKPAFSQLVSLAILKSSEGKISRGMGLKKLLYYIYHLSYLEVNMIERVG